MDIGIIGSGEMGICLASKFILAGHRVSMANSRGPESMAKLTGTIGIRAATVAEVVSNRDVVVVSVPTKNVPDLKPVFETLSKDTVVVDTMNYYPKLRDGFIAELDQSGLDSVWVQEVLGVPIVKAFNSILATSLDKFSRTKGDPNRIALAVSSDDFRAKSTVFSLIDQIGFEPFDIGTLAQSWKQQPGSPVYCRDVNLESMQRKVQAMQTHWQDAREQATAKRRADEALMEKDYPAYLKGLQDE